MSDSEIAEAVNAARSFSAAERSGVGATMMSGRMADRATDRIHRNTLKIAHALGRLNGDVARELSID